MGPNILQKLKLVNLATMCEGSLMHSRYVDSKWHMSFEMVIHVYMYSVGQ